MTEPSGTVSVRYMVDDVEEAVAFYTKVLDFEVLNNFAPVLADVARGNLRLLLSGPTSSAGRPMADGAKPGPGGWNRIHFIVDDIDGEVARLRDAGARFRNDIIEGPAGKQILLQDPSGNVVELFQYARMTATEPAVPVAPLGRASARAWVRWRSTALPRPAAMWTRIDSRMREYKALPLFAGCSRSQLRQVSRAATRLSPGARTVLVRQGQRPRQFVIVLSGTAEVWRDGQPIDEIGAGGYFGEIGLIRRIREPASIVARTAMTVDVIAERDVIAKREFAALYADLALVRQRMDHELDRRLAKWISASDARSSHAATALPFLLSPPASIDNHQPAPEQPSLARFRRAGARPMAVARIRRASR